MKFNKKKIRERKSSSNQDQSYEEIKAEIRKDAERIAEKLKLIDRRLYSKWKRAYLGIREISN